VTQFHLQAPLPPGVLLSPHTFRRTHRRRSYRKKQQQQKEQRQQQQEETHQRDEQFARRQVELVEQQVRFSSAYIIGIYNAFDKAVVFSV